MFEQEGLREVNDAILLLSWGSVFTKHLCAKCNATVKDVSVRTQAAKLGQPCAPRVKTKVVRVTTNVASWPPLFSEMVPATKSCLALCIIQHQLFSHLFFSLLDLRFLSLPTETCSQHVKEVVVLTEYVPRLEHSRSYSSRDPPARPSTRWTGRE